MRRLLTWALALELMVALVPAVPAGAQAQVQAPAGPFDFRFLSGGGGGGTSATVTEPTASPPAASPPAASPPAAAPPAAAPPAAGSAIPGARAVTGWVHTAAGLPVAGAAVELLHDQLGTVFEASTDGQGRFALVPAVGRDSLYKIRVWAAGYHRAETPWTTRTAPALGAVTVRPLGGSLQGRVAVDTAPVAGAEVRLLMGRGERVISTHTGADGRYRLAAPAGDYTVQVLAPGRVPWQGSVTVTDGGTAYLGADLAAAVTRVRGRLVDAAGGAGLGGARVELLRQGAGLVEVGETDADGRFDFVFPGIAGAQYQVRAWAVNHALAVSNLFAAEPGATVELLAGDSLAATAAYATVVGTLIDENGVPVRNADVQLDLKGVGTVARATTDEAGAFRFDTLAAGGGAQYRVRAIPWLKRMVDSGWFTPVGGEVRNFSFLAPYASLLTTNATGLIFGRISDAAGQPLAGVEVTVEREAQRVIARATTQGDGTFRVLVRANPGGSAGYLVRAAREGYITADQIAGSTTDLINVTADAMVQVNLTLRPVRVDVTGRVVDSAGGVAGAEVRLFRQGVGQVERTVTDATGMYSFTGLDGVGVPALLVAAERDGRFGDTGGTGANTLTDPGVARGLLPTITLPGGTQRLTGRITDFDRRPLGGIGVAVHAGQGVVNTTTDPDGQYSVDGLVPGDRVVVTATGRGHLTTASGLVTIGTTGSTQDFVLGPATTAVLGQLTDPAGRPVVGATVELLQDGHGVVQHTTTNDNGEYRFELPIAWGDWYTLRARTPAGLVSSQASALGDLSPLFPAFPLPTRWDLMVPGR